MDITIRPVRPEDLDGVARLEAACFPPAEAAGKEEFARRIAAFPECFLVAESAQGEIIGMINGAVTLGTLDGANVEIHQLVGDENIYIFGKRSEDVIRLYEEGTYSAETLYQEDKLIRELVDFIKGEELEAIGDMENLERLYKEIRSKDWFMALLDVKEYIQTKEKMLADYEDEAAWSRKALVNIAKAGYFSADRTIAEYNRDIWKLS